MAARAYIALMLATIISALVQALIHADIFEYFDVDTLLVQAVKRRDALNSLARLLGVES